MRSRFAEVRFLCSQMGRDALREIIGSNRICSVHIRGILDGFGEIRGCGVRGCCAGRESDYIEEMKVDHIAMDSGCVDVRIPRWQKSIYYEMLSESDGHSVSQGQYELLHCRHERAFRVKDRV